MRAIRIVLVLAPACVLCWGLLSVARPVSAQAAQWLAPAAEERITADWVREVATALKKPRYKNVFMNQPFGCDQCRVIEFLNRAADALDDENPKLAKSFVRRALNVFENGLEQGWYDEEDIQPIRRLIIAKANQGFKEAGASQRAMSPPADVGEDQRYQRGRPPMFSRSGGDEDEYGSRTDRWSGYTSQKRLGLTNEPPDRGSGGQSMSREEFRRYNEDSKQGSDRERMAASGE
ncbi:MAG TPA: hypothetical protein VJ746_15080 [Nitrospira sp.]|nr:hypothetical protein [Nitrospira sp.]